MLKNGSNTKICDGMQTLCFTSPASPSCCAVVLTVLRVHILFTKNSVFFLAWAAAALSSSHAMSLLAVLICLLSLPKELSVGANQITELLLAVGDNTFRTRYS
jgi:hypothetical protein